MRTTLLLPMGLLLAPALAQSPVIHTSNFFAVDHGYARDNYDVSPTLQTAIIGAAGADFNLDLGGVSSMPLYSTDSVLCTAAPSSYTYFSDYYDTANVMLTIVDQDLGASSQYLFRQTLGSVRYIGGQPNGATGTGNDLVFQRYPSFEFPMVLADDMDEHSGFLELVDGRWYDGSGSDDHYDTGTSVMAADGYGTVIMPDGALVTDVLRFRSVLTYTDSNAFFGVSEHQDTLYTWYAAGQEGPLMTLAIGFHALTSGYISPFPLTIYRLHEVFTSVNEVASDAAFTLVPNPASDRIVLNLPGQADATPDYTIHDAAGRPVAGGRLPPSRAIEVSSLPTGAYFLALRGRSAAVRPFLVVH